MRVRLTVTNVPTLRAGEHTDTLLPGFVLRVTPGGVRTFAVASWDGRRKRRIAIGRVDRMPLAEARARAREMIAALARREEPPRPAPVGEPLTVAELVKRMLADLELRPATKREWQRIAKVELVPVLGHRRAVELLRADVRAWLSPIRHRSGWIANHCLAVLRRAYTWAQREDLLEHNPCAGIPRPHEGPANDRVLSTVELRALVRALERGRRKYPAYASATRLLLLTAVRRSAALGATRQEFDGLEGDGPRWVVPAGRSKSGRQHVVPLSPAAVAVVRERLQAVKGAHLYPAGHASVRVDVAAEWAGRWRTWLRRRLERGVQAQQRLARQPIAPVPRWTIHSLRHTAATHMIEDLGVSRHVVSLILGHTLPGPAATKIYDRSELLKERRAALCSWADFLASLGVLESIRG